MGRTLYDAAATGGARALAQPVGALAVGLRADLLVLDGDAPALVHKSGDGIVDSLVFAGDRSCVRDVMVGGRWQIREGRHEQQDAILARYRDTLGALLA